MVLGDVDHVLSALPYIIDHDILILVQCHGLEVDFELAEVVLVAILLEDVWRHFLLLLLSADYLLVVYDHFQGLNLQYLLLYRFPLTFL